MQSRAKIPPAPDFADIPWMLRIRLALGAARLSSPPFGPLIALFPLSLTPSPARGTLWERSCTMTVSGIFPATGAPRPMSKPLVPPALAHFVASTAGRNMTKPAYVAVAAGVAMMVLLTVDPAYEAAHRWVDAVLWACLAFFVFEWVVRLRHAFVTKREWSYLASGRGLVDAVAAAAIPIALVVGGNPKSAWLFGIFWMLKVVPGVPGLRQLRRVLVVESGPLLSVLVIFLMVLFLASVAMYFLE